jgi:hypothetical protein
MLFFLQKASFTALEDHLIAILNVFSKRVAKVSLLRKESEKC